MADLLKITHATMRSMVKSYGCFDAVAEMLNARWGGCASKGTISKKMSGQLDWTLADVIALEDASGRNPITRVLARRLEGRVSAPVDNLVTVGGKIAKETGEAIAAILAADQSTDADDGADAVCEIDEAIVALRGAREKLVSDTPELVRGNLFRTDGAVPFKGPVS